MHGEPTRALGRLRCVTPHAAARDAAAAAAAAAAASELLLFFFLRFLIATNLPGFSSGSFPVEVAVGCFSQSRS